MKYLNYTLLLVLLFGLQILNAQNLVVNGDLESWTAGEPDGWTVIENISQETSNVHGGASAASHMSASSTKDFRQPIESIQGGLEYTISYWYYDNDPMARTRIWSYWTSGGGTIPDNGDILRPSVYSEDNASWQEFTTTLVAPISADGFRFEVRVYNQDGNTGGSVIYDDFVMSGDITITPEPSNYPTAFIANPNGTGIDLTWTDATGAQLPSAYIIMAGTDSSLPVPVDGTPVENDIDLSDGSGSLNVAFGDQAASFAALEANTTYYFTIYPYTNAAANIDFKTDGTAPAADVTTSNLQVIEFENFDESWGNWTTISIIGDEVWDRDNSYGLGSTPCAKMSGYNGGALDNEDWLISPELDLDGYDNIELNFFTAVGYTGPDLECKVSSDYSGTGDPNTATWMDITFTWSTEFFEWTESGNIDLSAYSGSSIYIAYKFTSTTDGSATWEVDNISITGEETNPFDPEPTNYPTNFTASADISNIVIDWTDATGAQLPVAYIVYAGTDATLPVPEDGIPVVNDPDLSDGNGALNVTFGTETVTFDGLDEQTTYYFTIYPYTNDDINIDYKNDGTAPATSAATLPTPEPTNYPSDFTAEASSTDILLLWSDATGAQLPDSYIVFAGTDAGLPVPVDGTPIANDPDLSDGSGALNVEFGAEEVVFDGLDPLTTYYFSIYPYTNDGVSTDYKNDGSAPAVDATTTSLLQEPSNYPTAFNAEANESGIIDLTWLDATGLHLPEKYIIFAGNSAGLPTPSDGVQIENDMDLSDGNGALNVSYGTEEALFDNLDPLTTYYFSIYPYVGTGENIDYKNDGTAPTSDATTVAIPEPTNYPTEFDATASEGIVNLSWTDAIGDQLPENYIVFAGTSEGLPTPTDGTAVEDDSDLSDGSGAINVSYGTEQTFFDNLDPYITYYFSIYPYTNSGENIDYKSDGTVPTANATTIVIGIDNTTLGNDKISIYPNPGNGLIRINMDNENFTHVEVRSLAGSLVSSFELKGTTGTYDLSELQSGIYFVVFINQKSNLPETHKLIIR